MRFKDKFTIFANRERDNVVPLKLVLIMGKIRRRLA